MLDEMIYRATIGASVVCAAVCFAACGAEEVDGRLLETEVSTSELTACPSTNVISDPSEFQWTYHPASANNPEPYYSGTMEMGEATFTIGGETLTTRAYRQAGTEYSIPGPTMTMVPGNKYVGLLVGHHSKRTFRLGV